MWGNSMKTKVKLKDFDGKVIEGEVNVPNKFHFEVQKNTRMNIFRDKTKYTRKQKHKKKNFDE